MATPTENTDSSTLSVHSQLVLQRFADLCTTELNRLIPQSDSGAHGVWNEESIRTLTAIFELQRVELTSESRRRRLNIGLISTVIHSLATRTYFIDLHSPELLLEMEPHIRLLAAALRLYKYRAESLQHDIHQVIYDGITRLSTEFNNGRSKRTENKVDENNVLFLLQHCQYLLVSIDSSESFRHRFSRRALQGFDIGMMIAARSYHNIRPAVVQMMQRQRSRPRWHDVYVELEDVCWSLFAGDIRVRNDEQAEHISELMEETHDAACLLREIMERHLPASQQSSRGVMGFVRNAGGRASQVFTASGPHDEHPYYLQYGILDLIYQMTIRIRSKSRKNCFAEFVKVVRIVLERSPSNLDVLHAKATDVWNRILEVGKEDRRRYGEHEDRNAIVLWCDRNLDKVEDAERSNKYSYTEIIY
jgi:hypothetical protein